MPGLIYADRVQETTTTTGTGTINLAGAATGYQSFASACVTGQTVYYTMTDGTNWEVGRGTFTTGSPNTLSRDVVLSSSNSGSLVNFPGPTTNVWLDIPASATADLARTSAFVMRWVGR